MWFGVGKSIFNVFLLPSVRELHKVIKLRLTTNSVLRKVNTSVDFVTAVSICCASALAWLITSQTNVLGSVWHHPHHPWRTNAFPFQPIEIARPRGGPHRSNNVGTDGSLAVCLYKCFSRTRICKQVYKICRTLRDTLKIILKETRLAGCASNDFPPSADKLKVMWNSYVARAFRKT